MVSNTVINRCWSEM